MAGIVAATIGTDWAADAIALAALIGLGISVRHSGRAQAEARRAAAAAERSARAADETDHQVRTPRFALRFVQQAGDVRELELLLLGPDDLAEVRFEVEALCRRPGMHRISPGTAPGTMDQPPHVRGVTGWRSCRL